MRTPHHHQRHLSTPHSLSARCLLVLLCLVSWRGPIPCLHAHGSAVGNDTKLAQHLHAYHAHHDAGRSPAPQFFSWHLHLLLPWERFDVTGESEKESSTHDPLTHDGAVVTALSYCEILTSLADAKSVVSLRDGDTLSLLTSRIVNSAAMMAPFTSFSESLLISAPQCAVTGVALV